MAGFADFVVIMFLVYYLAVGVVGSFTVDLVDRAFAALSDWTRNALAKIDTSEWLISLIVDGLLPGRSGFKLCSPIDYSFPVDCGAGNHRLYVADCVFPRPVVSTFGLKRQILDSVYCGLGLQCPGSWRQEPSRIRKKNVDYPYSLLSRAARNCR